MCDRKILKYSFRIRCTHLMIDDHDAKKRPNLTEAAAVNDDKKNLCDRSEMEAAVIGKWHHQTSQSTVRAPSTPPENSRKGPWTSLYGIHDAKATTICVTAKPTNSLYVARTSREVKKQTTLQQRRAQLQT